MAGFVPYIEEATEEYGPQLEAAANQAFQAVAAGITAIGAWVISQSGGNQSDAEKEKKRAEEKAEEAAKAADSASEKMPDEDPEDPVRDCKQYKKLSRGEIKKLQDKGIDPHDLKPKYNGSRYDLFKTKDGDIVVLPKNGVGEPDPTGFNVNDM